MAESLERPKDPMWLGQNAFLSHAYRTFQDILSELKCKLSNVMFLVGFQTDAPGGLSAARSHLEWKGFPEIELEEMFDDIKERMALFPDEELDEEKWRADYRKHEVFCSELRSGVLEVLSDVFPSEKSLVLCSAPCQVKNYLAAVVLVMSRADYEAQPHLSEEVSLRKNGVRPSLLYAVAELFLEELAASLPNPRNVNVFQRITPDVSEMLRTAGARFTHTAAWLGTSHDFEDIIKHGVYDLFNACGIISAQHYEGGESKGHLVLSERGHPAITVRMEFTKQVGPEEHKKIRKLLEMCNEETWLLFSPGGVYGLGYVPEGKYISSNEDVLIVRFVKHHCWEMVHNNQPLMRVTYNEPRLPQPNLNPVEMKGKLKDRIPAITDAEADHIVEIARMVSEANTGTMLVVTPDAVTETERLASQCFPMKPFLLDKQQVPSVLKIDGAVLLDENGLCHAIGAILDGRATPLGTSARGSRYNSAIRYVQEHKNAVALVVSEDGMVDPVAYTEPKPPATVESFMEEFQK